MLVVEITEINFTSQDEQTLTLVLYSINSLKKQNKQANVFFFLFFILLVFKPTNLTGNFF